MNHWDRLALLLLALWLLSDAILLVRGRQDGQRRSPRNPPARRGGLGSGPAAYFYSRDIARIWRVAKALECGIVGINEGIISPKILLARSRALRGMKESGIGREAQNTASKNSSKSIPLHGQHRRLGSMLNGGSRPAPGG